MSNKKEIELTTIGKELYKDIQKPMEGIEAAIVSVLSKKKKVLEKDYAKIYNIYKYL